LSSQFRATEEKEGAFWEFQFPCIHCHQIYREYGGVGSIDTYDAMTTDRAYRKLEAAAGREIPR
jgi:hypothetical protein